MLGEFINQKDVFKEKPSVKQTYNTQSLSLSCNTFIIALSTSTKINNLRPLNHRIEN